MIHWMILTFKFLKDLGFFFCVKRFQHRNEWILWFRHQFLLLSWFCYYKWQIATLLSKQPLIRAYKCPQTPRWTVSDIRFFSDRLLILYSLCQNKYQCATQMINFCFGKKIRSIGEFCVLSRKSIYSRHWWYFIFCPSVEIPVKACIWTHPENCVNFRSFSTLLLKNSNISINT